MRLRQALCQGSLRSSPRSPSGQEQSLEAWVVLQVREAWVVVGVFQLGEKGTSGFVQTSSRVWLLLLAESAFAGGM